jgi:hypothetical protein
LPALFYFRQELIEVADKPKTLLQRDRKSLIQDFSRLRDSRFKRYISDHNRNAKPFVWTKVADQIFEKLKRLPEASL